jgi:hypothetical protein
MCNAVFKFKDENNFNVCKHDRGGKEREKKREETFTCGLKKSLVILTANFFMSSKTTGCNVI